MHTISGGEENYYRNNPFLKKKGVKVEWTPEMVQEWIKCRDDVIYFAAEYMKIVHVDRGIIPFDMYEYQKDMAKSMSENRYSIFACARQSGKCLRSDTKIKIRNKTTGEISEVMIGDLYDHI